MAKINTQQKEPQRPAGFNCPQCSFFIEVTIQGLLYDDNHKCPGCGTVFHLNRQQSQTALSFVQKLHVAAQNLDSVDKFRK